jgi:uncharacterized OB-fold protein
MKVEPIQEGLFEVLDDNSGHLLINRCDRCGLSFYPRRISCQECLKDDALAEDTLTGTGTLYTFTVVHRALAAYETPYTIGYIDFEEKGIRVFGQIADCDLNDLQIGMKMEPFFEKMKMKDDSQSRMVCKFRPSQS